MIKWNTIGSAIPDPEETPATDDKNKQDIIVKSEKANNTEGIRIRIYIHWSTMPQILFSQLFLHKVLMIS